MKSTKYSDLLQIIHRLTLDLDTDQILEYIINSASKLVNSKTGSILLKDETEQQLYFKAVTGEKAENLKNIRFDVNEGIAGWVMREKKPLLVKDVSKDPRFFKDVDQTTGFQTKSIICVPIEIDTEVIGVLEILNSDMNEFSDEDFELIVALTRQAALAIKNARIFTRIKDQNVYLHQEIDDKYKMITASRLMKRILEIVGKAAQTESTVLINGESGAGKELVARSIYNQGPRKDGPFVAINCAALSEELLESELFGHEKGAFTGAMATKKGKMELANGGTLFLDEVAEMKLSLQAKLLRVLQEKCFERVGGVETISTDVRIICATNRNMIDEVKAGNFREDLYYRLNVIPIVVPPLRQRKEEIPLLALYFIKKFCHLTGQKVKKVTQSALNLLENYNWPGNIRELQNMIERIVVLNDNDVIQEEDVPDEVKNIQVLKETPGQSMDAIPQDENVVNYHDSVKIKKREILRNALNHTSGNQRKAAELLEIQPSYLSKLIKDLELKASV